MEQLPPFNSLTDFELPSKGLVYPTDSPWSSGKVSMRLVMAKDEDLLTNPNYIRDGVDKVESKFIGGLIVEPKNADISELIPGDRRKLVAAAKVLMSGAAYRFQDMRGTVWTVNLNEIDDKPLHEDFVESAKNRNEFSYIFPLCGKEVIFKLLTGKDEVAIEQETEGMRKVNPNYSARNTLPLKYAILSVNGDSKTGTIRDFVDNQLSSYDGRAIRTYIEQISPDIDVRLQGVNEKGKTEVVDVPINFLELFYADL